MQNNEKSISHKFDHSLFWVVLILLGLGTIAVYSASSTKATALGDSEFYLIRHLGKVIAGIVLMILVSRIDYHKIRSFSKVGIGAAIALLLILLITGGSGEIKGAERWLSVGPISFQPSEVAKWALIFHLAVLLDQKPNWFNELEKGYMPLFIWIGAVSMLVAIQPDFSSAVLIIAISFTLLIIAGLKKKVLLIGMAVAVPLVLMYMVMDSYRMDRLKSYLDGNTSGNYQLKQSLIAYGNGGLTGVGIGQSKQKDFYLPEPHNDFILPVIGEEYGLIGVSLLLGLFILLVIRGVVIVKNAPDTLGRYLAAGILVNIMAFMFINAAVSCGILPTTGLPMPFISYGGTSLILTCVAIGVLLNISKQVPEKIKPLAEVV